MQNTMMVFIGWIDCSSMRILVSRENQGFLCLKYVGSQKIVGAEKKCASKDELKKFLESLPNGNQADIEKVLNDLQK